MRVLDHRFNVTLPLGLIILGMLLIMIALFCNPLQARNELSAKATHAQPEPMPKICVTKPGETLNSPDKVCMTFSTLKDGSVAVLACKNKNVNDAEKCMSDDSVVISAPSGPELFKPIIPQSPVTRPNSSQQAKNKLSTTVE